MQSRAWRPRPLCLRRAENPRDRGRHRGDRLGCLDKRSSGRGGVKSQRLARRAVPTAAPAPYDSFGSRMPRSPLAGKTWRRPGGAVFSLWNLARSIPAYKNPPPFAVLEAAEITHRRASPARGNGNASDLEKRPRRGRGGVNRERWGPAPGLWRRKPRPGCHKINARSRRPVPVDGRCPRPATRPRRRRKGGWRASGPGTSSFSPRLLGVGDCGGRGRRKGNAGRGEHVPGKALTLFLTICA